MCARKAHLEKLAPLPNGAAASTDFRAPLKFADLVGVDEKTVDRWIQQGRKPLARHRQDVSAALGIRHQELWPDVGPERSEVPQGRLELVSAFAHADEVLAPDWEELLREASGRIDLLDYTLIHMLASPGIPRLLADKAADGCWVRVLISYATRADDRMLVTLHLWGTPAPQAPLLHLRAGEHPGMFAQFEHHFERVWEHACHPMAPDPDVFPDPDTHADHYEQLLLDDPPDEHHDR